MTSRHNGNSFTWHKSTNSLLTRNANKVSHRSQGGRSIQNSLTAPMFKLILQSPSSPRGWESGPEKFSKSGHFTPGQRKSSAKWKKKKVLKSICYLLPVNPRHFPWIQRKSLTFSKCHLNHFYGTLHLPWFLKPPGWGNWTPVCYYRQADRCSIGR